MPPTSSHNNNWYQDLPEEGRRIIHVLAPLLILGLSIAACAAAYSYAVSGWVSSNARYTSQFSVTGEGKVEARPDTAVFTTTIITQGKKVGDAQEVDTARSNAVIAFLKDKGVAAQDTKTLSYTITPQYVYAIARPCTINECPAPQPPTINSYEVRHALEIKVRDLGASDTLLAGVIARGANEVGQLSFRIDDDAPLKAHAQAEAIAHAQEKADDIARALGVRLTRITQFYENQGGIIPPMPYGDAGGPVMRASAVGPTVEPGQQEIRSSVTITYEFR